MHSTFSEKGFADASVMHFRKRCLSIECVYLFYATKQRAIVAILIRYLKQEK